ncbi:hypothetical protein M2459_003327 [Parabacteroides sp. PF5-5]|uniref:FimB/Mfa2 family fimbrial subunit n=1 Tax=unclassified Parabacteroides TaxID=2649774 RepID=UPI0024772427|nr:MULTISPECIES: FimB/Mfa2 family fimbrial subunit [unclassified Parabacteroides]MDH6306602.1 hypothetical protein [Parabacteroides sp. PH5-39]MDH6317569.1 hypothetical protein [Parabacteroides sp. PF5-13]MDH6321313.1 hypothetical protein [Parabacteroides sp. PH5-13]MDH6325045.1 hypothetical protein [Parabacteroides sp. PH5-8]MDH6328754.1 hypothetical protein [Parabacteroides sp. PH5-41]
MKPIKEISVRIAAFCTVWVFLLSSWGCVQDDLSECGIGVQFRYIKNVAGVDKFATAVERISLFVFSEDGRFISEFSDQGSVLQDNYIMTVPLKAGNYKLVAWGNLDECYDITDCIPGQTTIEEFMLKLNRLDDTVTEHPTHLFYGGVQEVGIEAAEGRRLILMDLTKDTNTIHVTARGLPVTDNNTRTGSNSRFQCTITSRNGDYNFDNSITGNRLTYIPKDSIEEKSLKSEFVVMRELNDHSTGSRLLITHQGESEDEEVLLDTSLSELLVPLSITGDLDIDDEFHLDVFFEHTNGHFTITINDWVVVDGGGGTVVG